MPQVQFQSFLVLSSSPAIALDVEQAVLAPALEVRAAAALAAAVLDAEAVAAVAEVVAAVAEVVVTVAEVVAMAGEVDLDTGMAVATEAAEAASDSEEGSLLRLKTVDVPTKSTMATPKLVQIKLNARAANLWTSAHATRERTSHNRWRCGPAE